MSGVSLIDIHVRLTGDFSADSPSHLGTDTAMPITLVIVAARIPTVTAAMA